MDEPRHAVACAFLERPRPQTTCRWGGGGTAEEPLLCRFGHEMLEARLLLRSRSGGREGRAVCLALERGEGPHEATIFDEGEHGARDGARWCKRFR